MPEFDPTDEQLSIIEHDPIHPARILAGPGTGKSSTVVALINKLFEKIPPPQIRLLTFTRAATAELAQKVSTHSAEITLRPCTIHSFAISVLMQNPGSGNILIPLRIADDWETKKIIEPTLAIRSRVTVQKLRRLILEMAANWESLCPEPDPTIHPEERSRFLGAWNEHRRVYGYTLLAELPYALRAVLRDHPDIEGADLDVLIVDEYQDLNACELELLKLLFLQGCIIIAAGDDDQSIYSFRKADPEGIRRFLNDYPGAHDYYLSITQRCGRRLVDWASYVIEGDPDRPSDRPRPTSAERLQEGVVALLSFPGHVSEAKGIATLTKILVEQKGVAPSEILILFRSDYRESFSKLIKCELDTFDIPYSDPNAVNGILAEPCNRRILAFFRLMTNRYDSIAWTSLFKLTPGIGESFVTFIYNLAQTDSIKFGEALLQAYQTNFRDCSIRSARIAHSLIQSVLAWLDSHAIPAEHDIEWGQWILEIVGSDLVPSPTEDLRNLFLQLDQYIESEPSFDRYLGQITPLCRDIAFAQSEGVRILTLGGAKGLSVRATIIGGVEEGIVPRPVNSLSEERRLLYVGMTRAKEFLFCTWARRRRGPTARAGSPWVGMMRSHSTFFNSGPVESQNGPDYITNFMI